MSNNWPHVINLGNSIIGVTVLAMPFCFQQCGIILGALVLFFCTWLTLVSCQLLIKAGISSRKRSYGFLAQYTHGAPGKLSVELGMIGLQIGTLIAQVVIIGDLGPAIISKWTGLENSSNLRTGFIILACLGIGLPLGLLRNLETVSRASTGCIMFYTLFVFYVITLSIPNLKAANWLDKVNIWRVDGLFKCLPIFSFAFGCQTQLFILYDALPEPSLKEINSIVKSAVNMCTVAYLLVGFFGYIAFCDTTIGGDIITQFSETMVADIVKIFFVTSIVVTFPLIIFPCRGSFYTLLFAPKPKQEDIESRPVIPELHFKAITICIVIGAMVTGILVPNVEFVLAMNGATMGTLICYIFPAVFFLRVMASASDGKNLAQIVFVFGVTIMILCTYTTLNSQDHVQPKPIIVDRDVPVKADDQPVKVNHAAVKTKNTLFHGHVDTDKKPPDKQIDKDSVVKNDKRIEPPNPAAPEIIPIESNGNKLKNVKKDAVIKNADNDGTGTKVKDKKEDKVKKDTQKDVSKEATTQNPDSKINLEKRDVGGKNDKVDTGGEAEKKQLKLIEELQEQQKEQKKLIQEQREILKELKDHKRKAHDNVLEDLGIDQQKDVQKSNIPQPQLNRNDRQVAGDAIQNNQPLAQNIKRQVQNNIPNNQPLVQNINRQVQNNIQNNQQLPQQNVGVNQVPNMNDRRVLENVIPNNKPLVQSINKPIQNDIPNNQQPIQQNVVVNKLPNKQQNLNIAANHVPDNQKLPLQNKMVVNQQQLPGLNSRMTDSPKQNLQHNPNRVDRQILNKIQTEKEQGVANQPLVPEQKKIVNNIPIESNQQRELPSDGEVGNLQGIQSVQNSVKGTNIVAPRKLKTTVQSQN